MKVTTLDEASIRDIGQAFGHYNYGEEHGLIDAFPSRDAAAAFICGYVRMALQGGMLHTTSPRGEGYLAYKRPGQKLSLRAMLPLAKGFLGAMDLPSLVRFTRIMAQGGQGLDKRLDREKKPYIFVGLVCVRQAYQGQGYMRRVLEMAFAEGQPAGHSGDSGDRRPVQMRQIPASWHEACRYAPVRHARSALRPHPIPGNKIKTDSRPHRRCTTPDGIFLRLSGHRRQLHAAACIENGGRCHKRLGGIAMKLAFFDAKPYDRPGFDAHAAGTGLEIRYFETKLGEDTVQLARGFDGVCVFVNDTVNAKVADELYRLGVRVIALRCAGFNNVDTRACRGRLRIFRVPAYSPYAVAEHAMALLLTVNRHTHKAYIRTRDFNFSLSGLTGFDLHGKTAGVVGTGKIGRVFAEICRGFGMRVLAYDKFPDPGSGLCYAALPELFHQADVISLHCPLTDETRHMIDAAAIAGMKPGVVIVNTSRGALVDTEALIEGLRSRKIGAACLDVYEEEAELFYEDRSEAIIEDDTLVRLIAMPNVIVSSHQAFLTKEALNNIAAVTVDNLLKFGRGEPSPDTEVCAPKEQDQRRS